jgi:hypothetical protein
VAIMSSICLATIIFKKKEDGKKRKP